MGKKKFQLNEEEFDLSKPEEVISEITKEEPFKDAAETPVQNTPKVEVAVDAKQPQNTVIPADIEAIIASEVQKRMAMEQPRLETRGRKKNPNLEKKTKVSVDLPSTTVEDLKELCRKYQKENGITKNVGVSTYINILCEREVEKNRSYLEAHR